MTSKPIIGVLLSNLLDNYPRLIWNGIQKAAEDLNINTITFPGESLNTLNTTQYQHGIIYDFINSRNLDGLIILSSNLALQTHTKNVQNFLRKLRNIPSVCIGISIPGNSAIETEEKAGIYQAVEHIARIHNVTKAGFISGPENIPESKNRNDFFLKAFKKYNIELKKTFQGNFLRESGRAFAKELILSSQIPFQALFCANDNMAIGAMKEFQEHGIWIPDDIIITGFDDQELSRCFVPPLSTIRQPLFESGYKALQEVLDRLSGSKDRKIVLNTEFVPRASCGCFQDQDFRQDTGKWEHIEFFKKTSREYCLEKNLSEKDFLQKTFRLILEDMKERSPLIHYREIIVDLIKEKNHSKDLSTILKLILEYEVIFEKTEFYKVFWDYLELRSVLYQSQFAENFEELYSNLRESLPILNMSYLFIAGYKTELTVEPGEPFLLPEEFTVEMLYKKNKEQVHKNFNFKMEGFLPSFCRPDSTRWSALIYPLFFQNRQYGYLVYEYNEKDMLVYDILANGICTTIRNIHALEEQRHDKEKLTRLLQELEEMNKRLSNLSETDDMTGLYNRRGFYKFAQHQLDLAVRLNKSGALFFMDLDGLKAINDTLGHHYGDKAIQASAEILPSVFRQTDVLARLGGDEFAAICIEVDDEFISMMKNRLNEKLAQRNRETQDPFPLEISMGGVLFKGSDHISLDSLLQQADKSQYKVKQQRKLAKVRNSALERR